MGIIKKEIEERIKEAASVVDALEDCGVVLHKHGADYWGICPFHQDKNMGSFVVNPKGNYYKCFSCGESGDAVKAIMKLRGIDYPDALRYLAAKYNIYVDDEPVPEVKKSEARTAAHSELQWVTWPLSIVKDYLNRPNNLTNWIESLPMRPAHMDNYNNMKELYLVGTAKIGKYEGWTIWWYVDDKKQVRRAKFMRYKPDGHRDRLTNPTWMHSVIGLDLTKYETRHCLFGLHLVDAFKDAEICIVESEKSALICSIFSNPYERLWLATGGMQFLTKRIMEPLIERKRNVVLYPDIDGYEEWERRANEIGYERLRVTDVVRREWEPDMGDKADMADIMAYKIINGHKEAKARMENQPAIKEMVEMLGLEKLN